MRFAASLKFNQGCQRTEGLIIHAFHRRRYTTQNSGREEAALVGLRFDRYGTSDAHRALRDRVSDVSLHFIEGLAIDQRPHRDASLQTVTHFDRVDARDQLFRKRIRDALLHVNSIGTHTRLTGSAKFICHQLIDSMVDIGVFKHNEGCVATEFQC